jgi:hypothetical protein
VKTEVIKTGTLEGVTVPIAPLKAPTVVFEQQGVKVNTIQHLPYGICTVQLMLAQCVCILEHYLFQCTLSTARHSAMPSLYADCSF